MRDRTAVDTIKGYFYQFDYSIYKIMNLDEDEGITVEGIEDVDVHTATEEAAVQCKYYSKSEYNHSVIAKPIRLMLSHYKEVKDGIKPSIKYYLYGIFKSGTDKLVLPIDNTFLKEHFLTYTQAKKVYKHHINLGLSDVDLNDFLNKLTININGKNYDEQVKEVIYLLRKNFYCSEFEAENFYYNNALKVIKDISTKSNISERFITKKEFVKSIDKSQVLFNEWFIKYKGKKQFFASIRNEYFAMLNVLPFERFFLIEIDKYNYKRSVLKELIFIISKKWTRLSKREPNPFCPYVYVHNISPNELCKIKLDLYNEKFKFVDGFVYNGASFSAEAITQEANCHNNIKIKIIDNLDYLRCVLNYTTKTKEVYQFYIKNQYFDVKNDSIKDIKIQIESLNDIKEII
ncbi:DUF4297 family anti-phage-associated protein [Clostridium felsineum]|uniref:DUF4297 family anti-phage-associated protein n=1 Tax=Clostridium felsineum TaxID=36839 RepID=UPI00098C266D|nr:DUF4297 family anti-phage-associated protein [Clostridium felsineum]URZ04040.1 hypothetical protein CLAUR_041060 [Clostridium felsineum]